MQACDRFENVFLDMLYGLLEEQEAQQVRDHVAECASCRMELEKAQNQRLLLARAALAVPHTDAFVAPASLAEAPSMRETVAISVDRTVVEVPANLPLPTRRRFRTLVQAGVWAAAASVLAAVGIWWHFHDQEVENRRGEVAALRRKVDEVQGQLASIPGAVKVKLEESAVQAKRSRLHLQVLGSRRYDAATQGRLQVLVNDLEGRPQKTRLEVDIAEAATGNILHRESFEAEGEKVLGLAVPGNVGPVSLTVKADNGFGKTTVKETLLPENKVYRTHLTSNKRVYRTGEVLFYRTLTLDRFTHRPAEGEIPLRFELVNQQGRTVKELLGRSGAGGIAAGTFALTDDLPSGNYTLRAVAADSARNDILGQEKPIEIVHDEGIRVEFDRAQYAPGDAVNFGVRFNNTQRRNSPLDDLSVRVVVDGKELAAETFQAAKKADKESKKPTFLETDAAGNANLRFRLPARIEQGRAQVEVYRQAEGKKAHVQDIPVVPSRLAIDLYPEGGDLVAGVANKVYYRVRTPEGEPLDPEGHVIVLSGNGVVYDSPRGRGTGSFTFVPDGKETYSIRITGAQGRTDIERPFADLGPRTDGVALHVPNPVLQADEPLAVLLRNPGPERRLLLAAHCRGRIIDQRFVTAGHGETKTTLHPDAEVQGVVRLTLYAAASQPLLPLAERLVFRGVKRKLDLGVSVREGNGPFPPGKPLNLSIRSADEKGRPAAAWLLASVVDERYLSPRPEIDLLKHFFLSDAVEPGLEIEQFPSLDMTDAAARRDLDLFLGTHGWRRFIVREKSDAPALATLGKGRQGDTGSRPALFFSTENAGVASLRADYQLEVRQIADRLRDDAARRQEELRGERERLAMEGRVAWLALQDLEALPGLYFRAALGFLTLAFMLLGGILLAWGIFRSARKVAARQAFVGSFASLAACLVLLLFARNGMGPLPEPESVPAWAMAREFNPGTIPSSSGKELKTFLPAGPIGPLAEANRMKGPQVRGGLARISRDQSGFALANKLERQRDAAGLVRNQFPVTGPSLQRNQAMNQEMQRRFLFAQQVQDLYHLKNQIRTGAVPGGVPAPTLPPPKAAGADKGPTNPPAVPGISGGGGFGPVGPNPLYLQELVREYAHRNGGRRLDIQDTLLWHPALNATGGKVEVEFESSGNPGNFRLLILGNAADGRLGTLTDTLPIGR